MTAPIVPDFIFNLFHEQVSNIVKDTLNVVSNAHSIPFDDLLRCVERKMDLKLNIISDKEEKIKIIRLKPRKLPDNSERCMARVKDTEHGGFARCKAKHMDSNCDLCRRHRIMAELRYGRIDDEDNECNVVKIRRIRKLY